MNIHEVKGFVAEMNRSVYTWTSEDFEKAQEVYNKFLGTKDLESEMSVLGKHLDSYEYEQDFMDECF